MDEVLKNAAPYIDLIEELVSTGVSAREISRPHEPNSPASELLERQPDFAGAWLNHPVEGLFSQVDVTMRAAEDSMTAFVTLMRSESPPTYSHHSNVRTALECMGTVRRLISPRRRAKDRMVDFLNLYISEIELRLRIPEGPGLNHEVIINRAAELASAAEVLNESLTKKNSNKVQYIGSPPPGKERLVKELLGDDALGATIYLRLSGSAHGGFVNSLIANTIPIIGTSDGNTHTVGIMRSSLDVTHCACALALGHVNIFVEYARWNGHTPTTERMKAHRKAQEALDQFNRIQGMT